MANYTLLKEGAQGEEVKKLQRSLQEKNYDLGASGVDGIYGPKTAQAVRAYQTDRGLAVDGIAGTQTLGSLYADQEVAAPSKLEQAENDLLTHQAQKPGPYESQYESILGALSQAFLDREDFSYDVDRDALYRQLQDSYTARGRLAMRDSAARAQAQTGGYGNSYAQGVGQQAYQDYLGKLTDRIPELYSLARSNYDAQGQELLQKLSLVQKLEDEDYARYESALSQWLEQQEYLRDVYEDQRAYDDKAAQAAAKTSAKGSTTTKETDPDDAPVETVYDRSTIKEAQEFIGLTPDGEWSEQDLRQANARGYRDLDHVYMALKVRKQYIRMKYTLNRPQRTCDDYLKQAVQNGFITQRDATTIRDDRYL